MAEPPTKRRRLHMSETFVALVGKNKKKFILYTEIATRSSKFFEAAMNRDWKESREKEVTLADVDESCFEGYLQWLNSGEVAFVGKPSLYDMTKLYIVGDFLDDSAFCDVILDCMVERACEHGSIPISKTVRMAWQRTVKNSPIRTLFLELWNSRCLSTQIRCLTNPEYDFPRDFIVELYQHAMASRNLDRYISRDERIRMVRACRCKITQQQADGLGR